jgi:two-component system nitrogen regulation response regulator GlnG
MPFLLAIDDDPAILHSFKYIFRNTDLTLLTAATGREALDMVAQRPPDVVILDLNLPDMSGMDTFHRLRQIDARIPVIFITGHGTTETAIEAIKFGAYDYLLKENLLQPSETARLRELVGRALEISRLMHVPATTPDEPPSAGPADRLVGRCPAMQAVYKAIGRVAPQDVTVLILGESGTGKELVARAIYQHSRRGGGPFLTINCAAIPEQLLESELFGHEKGAYTGADRKRIGKFEQCNGGTLFLDEIGDMTPLTQTKVLRLLQDQRFERLGGNETVQTNVRLIAATNRDLESAVTAGQFRSDLYYRLGVFTIHLPPLRERGDDLSLLVEHFLKHFNRDLGKDMHQVTPEAMALLRKHSWPGNLRELQSVLKQTLLQAAGPILLPEFLPAYLQHAEQPVESAPPAAVLDWQRFVQDRLQADSTDLYAEALTLMERHLLTEVLRFTNGNQVHAAKILGITRNSLRFKIRTHDITIERSVW